MTMPGPIPLDLDPSGYLAGLGQADQQTQQFTSTLRGLPVAIGPVQRAMDAITPKRALLLGLGAAAAGAAATQQQLAGMQAQARVTGVNFNRLTGDMRSLAKEFPVGNRGAQEMVKTLTSMGVAGTGTDKALNGTSKAAMGLQKSVLGSIPAVKDFATQFDKTFGNRGTVTDPGTAKRISGLSKAFVQLGAATNENATVVGRGMIQLNRAMGTGLGVERIEKLNDSLTTTAARTGASASGVLEFSRMIAPMARSAGIGQTAVMGIAGAFSQMGEDGFGASTAVNKIMADLARSVREGTPNMAAYAEMVGKTRGEFEALFKQNPAEALLQITEALGNDPANAPRLLESVGLEGVRTARALQGASQSGLLRNSVQTAVGGYGNGSTARAAEEAMDGLIDSGTRAAAAAEQLGEAMGRPLLGPLTTFTDALGAATSGIAGVAGNRVMQTAMSAAVALAIPALLAAKLVGPALVASGIGQMATSGPGRSMLGGIAMGMAGTQGGPMAQRERALRTWAARIGGADAINRYYSPGGRMGGNQQWDERNRSLFTGRANAVGGFIGMGGGGPNLLRQAGNLAALGTGAYMRMQAEQFRQVRTGSGFDRTPSRMIPFGNSEANQAFTQRLADIREDRDGGKLSGRAAFSDQRQAFGAFRKEMTDSTGSLRAFNTQLIRGTGAMAIQGGAAGISMGARGAMSAGRGLGQIAGVFGGGIGMLAMGGMAGYGAYRSMVGRREEQAEESASATSFIDEYRVAMGKATDASSTFAGKLETAADSMVNSVTSLSDALRIDAKDIEAAAAFRDKPVRTFSGTAGAAGRQLALEQQTYGMAPDEIARIGLDLFNQFDESGANEALGMLNPAGAEKNALASSTSIGGSVNDLVNAKDRGGWASVRRRFDLNRLGESRFFGDPRGTGWHADTLSEDTWEGTKSLAVGVSSRESQRRRQYGDAYATQEARREMDEGIQTAMDRGDNAQVQALGKEFQTRGGAERTEIPWQEIKDAGGFTNWMASQNESWAGRYGEQAGPEVQARERAGLTFSQLQNNPLQDFFDERSTTSAATAVQGLLARPEDPELRSEAISQLMSAADKSSTGLVNLAIKAGEAAEAQGNVASTSFQLIMALRQTAMQTLQVEAPFQTAGDNAMQRGQMAAGAARLAGGNTETDAARAQGVQDLIAVHTEAVGAATAKLTAVREQQVAKARQKEDYGTQREYAGADFTRGRLRQIADFGRQRSRMLRQFNLQEMRSEEDFQLSVMRAEEDFRTQRLRGERDFGISMVQATQDYNKARFRAQRDFDLQMRRQVEDTAKTLYDPYARIQVAPTWDMGSLTGNLKEQTESLRKQLLNLNQVKEMGLDQSVVDLLGLTDPKNAQQLQQTINDLTNDPALVGTLNNLASDRLSVTGALLGDPSNTQTRRQVEDLGRALSDMATDFDTQTRRSSEAYRRGQEDATRDFARTMDRQYADFTKQLARAEADLATTLSDMGTDHRIALDRAAQDRDTAFTRMADQQALVLKRMGEDITRMDQVVVSDLQTLTGALNTAMSGQFVNFDNLTQSGLEGWAKTLKQFIDGDWSTLIRSMSIDNIVAQANQAAQGSNPWRQGITESDGPGIGSNGAVHDIPGEPPQVDRMMGIIRSQFPGARLHSGIRYGKAAITATGNASYHGMGRAVDIPPDMDLFNWIKSHYGAASKELIFSPANKGQIHNGQPHYYADPKIRDRHWDHIHWAMAKGGVATKPTKTLIGEAGDNEAIIPLNLGGVRMLAEAMDLHLGKSAMMDLQAGRGTTHITYHSDSYLYDHSTTIEKVELQAENPQQMLAKLGEMNRRANLTRPAQQKAGV